MMGLLANLAQDASLHDNDAGQQAKRNIFRFGVAANGIDVPTSAGRNLVGVKADGIHRWSGTQGEEAFLAFQSGTVFLKATERVAA